MTDTTDPIPHRLIDSDTGQDLGPATTEQIAASDRSESKGQQGHILIDADGDVLDESDCPTWTGVRRVYTERG